jgi:putative FmdB family regulatory protein
MLRSAWMPTYDYRCPEGHVFELFQRMSDPPPAACVVCGATPVERVLSPVAVHFKGSGFYATDYGKGAKKREAAKDGDGGSADGKDTKKAEDKPASTTPAEKSSS